MAQILGNLPLKKEEKEEQLTIKPLQREPKRATMVLRTVTIVAEEPFGLQLSSSPLTVSEFASSSRDFVSKPGSMLSLSSSFTSFLDT